MNTVDKVKRTITEYDLIRQGDRVLCALSGGSDSVAMLHILIKLSYEMGFEVLAAHVNHGIRAEADKDEDFVKKLCEDNDIKCFVKKADVPAYAAKHKMSSELAGRKIRYGFFEEIRKSQNINKIATAHNKNDSAESVLLHMTRGCGIDGMCGISPKRDAYIIRPVIGLTKSEIEDYCKSNNYEFAVDKTNFEADYTRNKIRLHLLPLIEKELNPGFVDTVTENTEVFKEAADFIGKCTDEAYGKYVASGKADIEGLLKEHNTIIKGVIQLMYRNFRKSTEKLSVKHINDVLNLIGGGANKVINLPGGISVAAEYGKLKFIGTDNKNESFSYTLTIGEEKFIPEINAVVQIKREKQKKKNTAEKIYFYADDAKSFSVRSKINGDYFYPYGMKGRKKLSDLFTDIKLERSKRNKVPILTCGGDIVWVAGIRSDRRFSQVGTLMSCEIRKCEDNNI